MNVAPIILKNQFEDLIEILQSVKNPGLQTAGRIPFDGAQSRRLSCGRLPVTIVMSGGPSGRGVPRSINSRPDGSTSNEFWSAMSPASRSENSAAGAVTAAGGVPDTRTIINRSPAMK
jgi:hypothetical protein